MKKLGIFLLAALFLLSMLACEKKESHLDMAKLEEEILSLNAFEEPLNEIDEDTFKMVFSIEDFEEKAAYISSGGVSDEFILVKLKDKSGVEEGVKKLEERVKEQIAAFENYVPEQVPKLENALVKSEDKYIVLLVSENEEARNLVNKYFH